MIKILLDMDGVLCNWVKGTCELFDLNYEDTIKNWKLGNFDIEDSTGISSDSLWKAIDAAGEDWWANLEEYSWSKSFYQQCCNIADTYFVTSPSKHPSSLSGKLQWIQKFTGDPEFRNYLIGPKKYLCARDNQILVDDNDDNIRSFREHGGFGILFPACWNNKWAIEAATDSNTYVLDQILKIKDIFSEHKGIITSD